MKLEDLIFISEYALDNNAFKVDLNENQGEGDAQAEQNKLALFAWAYTTVSAFDKATDYTSLGVKKGGKKILKAAYEKHHSWPKFLGGKNKQELIKWTREKHREFHNELNKFLRKIVDKKGNTMEPKRGNSGRKIRRNFSSDEIVDTLKKFYEKTGDKYKEAKEQFLKQLDNK